jgi:hypothetical protein
MRFADEALNLPGHTIVKAVYRTAMIDIIPK